MNRLIRSSTWLWGGGRGLLRAHIVPASASFSFCSLAAEEEEMCSGSRRFPYLWYMAGDLENLKKPEHMISDPPSRESYHKIFHHLQISKIQSQEATVNYFDSIPKRLRDFRVCSLFSAFYAQAMHLEGAKDLAHRGILKAEIPFDLNREVDCVKLDLLMQEIEQVGKCCCNHTLNTRLHAYAALSDIAGMEKFLSKMEADPGIQTNCQTYIIAANGYLEAGLVDQVVPMMHKSEKLLNHHGNPLSFCLETLLAFYTDFIPDKAQLYRFWNSYKSRTPSGVARFDSSFYMSMISSLLKFDDLDGAEEIFEEWDSRRTSYFPLKIFDIRIPNMMIAAYSQKGLWEKAEACLNNKIVATGNEPDPESWDRLAAAYVAGDQMSKALETIKKAVSTSPEWRLHPHFEPVSLHTLFQCFKYLLSRQRDARDEAPDEIWRLIREHPHFLEMKGDCAKEFEDDHKDELKAIMFSEMHDLGLVTHEELMSCKPLV